MQKANLINKAKSRPPTFHLLAEAALTNQAKSRPPTSHLLVEAALTNQAKSRPPTSLLIWAWPSSEQLHMPSNFFYKVNFLGFMIQKNLEKANLTKKSKSRPPTSHLLAEAALTNQAISRPPTSHLIWAWQSSERLHMPSNFITKSFFLGFINQKNLQKTNQPPPT